MVDSDGHLLSAAQEQQVALARLVLKDPSVAILDEATAEAGSSAARLRERAADAVTMGRTMVTIAHRLSQAARVIVMERGRVVEQGPHDELVARGGQYTRLWRAWSTHR